MTTKNLGTLVSGYLDPDLRNWEAVVLQQGKPVLDREINLIEDLDIGASQTALRRTMPSGWLSDDFTSSSTLAIFTPVATADTIQIPQNLSAHVNGWFLNIANTDVSGINQLTLTAGPAGAGAKRTDIVILEVWRRLIGPSSSDGKSATDRIWRYGNVRTSPADDLTLNLADDLLDGTLGTETTKRVQIQYRLRVISGIDIFAYPYGMDDPVLVAQSVPASAGLPDGNVTLFTYSNQSANGDSGLWRAGDGDPANTLGTVDGYMYAIPLLAVFRRNTTAFDRNTNHNGGVASPGPSDRPDGLFHDILDVRDIVDLRLGVSPIGWNFQEVLEKNVNYLFDNGIKTEWVLTGIGGGVQGHTVLWADEIGITNGHGGDGITTGDTPGAAFVGEFDAVRRTFSDRSMPEILNVKIPMPGGGWPSSTFTVDFTSLSIYPYSAFNWVAFTPTGVVATDLLAATFIGDSAGKKTFDALSNLTQITGLGAVPIGNLTLQFDALTGMGVTDEDLYLEILVTYPGGVGLTNTPTGSYGSLSYEINNPGALPAGLPVAFDTLSNLEIDSPHREVRLQYTTVSLILTMAADTTVAAKSSFRMPERVDTIVSVLKNAVPIIGATTVSSDGRTVTFSDGSDFTDPGDVLDVTYTALRPLPQNGEQLTIWYENRAPQTARDVLLGTTLTLTPRYIPSHLYVITTGSGSPDEGYPFASAYVQTGGIYPSSGGSFSGEHELAANATVSISDFVASTGLLKLPVYVPFVPNPEELTFTRSSPGDIDAENRTFFKTVPGGSYLPNAYSQDLSDPGKHKVVFPFLAELPTTSSLGVQGQLVLVLLTRWATFDQTNAVYFDSDLAQNTTTASVFRLKGNLLNRRT